MAGTAGVEVAAEASALRLGVRALGPRVLAGEFVIHPGLLVDGFQPFGTVGYVGDVDRLGVAADEINSGLDEHGGGDTAAAAIVPAAATLGLSKVTSSVARISLCDISSGLDKAADYAGLRGSGRAKPPSGVHRLRPCLDQTQAIVSPAR